MKGQRIPLSVILARALSLAIFFPVAACGHSGGLLISSVGSQQSGLVRFDRCVPSDGTIPSVDFAESAFSLGWTKIPVTSLRSIITSDGAFLIMERNGGQRVFARPLVAASLYEFCEIRYQSTMFRSVRYDVLRYLYVDDSGIHEVSQDPEAFLRSAEILFAPCPRLVEELRSQLLQPTLPNAQPQGPDRRTMVEREDLVNAVQRFHACKR